MSMSNIDLFQIIRPITGPVLTVTIFAVIIAYLHDKDPRINLTNNVVPLLSVVVGLILVFRYASASLASSPWRPSLVTLTTI